jgi:phage shock protein C
MYCNYCGKLIPVDANCCAYCGRRVIAGASARRKLVRPRVGRKIAGVCLGFAEYFDVDITLVRLLWLLAGILTFPLGEVAYLIAWIVMPEEPEIAIVAAPSNEATNRTA